MCRALCRLPPPRPMAAGLSPRAPTSRPEPEKGGEPGVRPTGSILRAACLVKCWPRCAVCSVGCTGSATPPHVGTDSPNPGLAPGRSWEPGVLQSARSALHVGCRVRRSVCCALCARGRCRLTPCPRAGEPGPNCAARQRLGTGRAGGGPLRRAVCARSAYWALQDMCQRELRHLAPLLGTRAASARCARARRAGQGQPPLETWRLSVSNCVGGARPPDRASRVPELALPGGGRGRGCWSHPAGRPFVIGSCQSAARCCRQVSGVGSQFPTAPATPVAPAHASTHSHYRPAPHRLPPQTLPPMRLSSRQRALCTQRGLCAPRRPPHSAQAPLHAGPDYAYTGPRSPDGGRGPPPQLRALPPMPARLPRQAPWVRTPPQALHDPIRAR